MAMLINEIVQSIHNTALEKGWWDESKYPTRTFGDTIALCHSELSEALEEFRDGHPLNEIYYEVDGKPEGVPVELADVIIRICDMAARWGMDLEGAIGVKMAYNAKRPVRHGGKAI